MEEREVVEIAVADLVPGMIAARDVYSKNDQLLVGREAIIDPNAIAKLTFFDIFSIPVYVDEHTMEDEVEDNHEFKNQADRITFESFKEKYDTSMINLKDSMNQLLTIDDDIDEKRLVEDVETVISTTGSKYQVFDMLHYIKDFDDETFNHSVNVALICNVFADWLNMSDLEKKKLTMAGLFHDIGKLLINKEVLKKPGRLSDEEYEIIKEHPVKGYEAIKDKNLAEEIKRTVLSHHERCDGKGYPFGMKINEIDEYAAITAIADVYEAMTATRVYRKGLSPFRVIKLFEEEGRQQFNPVYLMPILSKLTDTYVRHECRLSDDRRGTIVMINTGELHKPIVQVDNEFIDLTKKRDLFIEEVY